MGTEATRAQLAELEKLIDDVDSLVDDLGTTEFETTHSAESIIKSDTTGLAKVLLGSPDGTTHKLSDYVANLDGAEYARLQCGYASVLAGLLIAKHKLEGTALGSKHPLIRERKRINDALQALGTVDVDSAAAKRIIRHHLTETSPDVIDLD